MSIRLRLKNACVHGLLIANRLFGCVLVNTVPKRGSQKAFGGFVTQSAVLLHSNSVLSHPNTGFVTPKWRFGHALASPQIEV